MLDSKLIKDFTKAVAGNSQAKTTPNLYGTAVIDASGNKFVKIDGSTINTPIVSTLDVKNNDRVLVTIENHTAKISSNLTTPASGYQATDLYKKTVVGGQTELSGKVVALIMESADGKTKNYYSATAPAGTEFTIGDTWFDTSNGYKMSNWNGTAWEAYVLGNAAIGILKAGNIDAGAITAEKINVDNLSTISAELGDITGGSININNNFMVDSEGNLIANSGKFGGDLNGELINIGGTVNAHVEVTNTAVVFKDGINTIGYLAEDKLKITNIEVSGNIYVGKKYSIKEDLNGNFIIGRR